MAQLSSRTTIDRPLAVVDAVNTASPATYWVSVDHLNRPFRMTNAARVSVWDAVWLPWGGVHSITGSASLDARFPGQWFQAETGLHYNWHRSYDPSLGRYTQPDPLGFVDGPSVYGYGRASPVKFSDFDGRSANTPSIPKTIPKPVTGLPGIILGACLLTLEYILERKQRKHNCILQHEEDSRWCDNNFIGYRNAVCHQWAGDNLSLCLKGEPRKRWDEVDPGP